MVTTMLVPRGTSAGWDLPVDAPGIRDSPVLAAVAARYLSDRRSGAIGDYAARNYWTMKHSLRSGRSCFSFWAPGSSMPGVAKLATVARPVPDAELLTAVKRDQLIQAAHQADDPTTAVGRALHAAAWGETACLDVGCDEAVLASIDGDALATYLAAVVPRAELTLLDSTTPAAPRPLRPDQPALWRAGVELVDKPWSQFVVGVSVGFDLVEVDETALAVLCELLGTRSDGLLAAQLRSAKGLAYAATATARREHGRAVLSAGANTDRGNVLECARVLLDVVDGLPRTPPDPWWAAARRLKGRLVAALDHPFAGLDECRRTSLGQVTMRDLMAAVDATTERLISRPPTPVEGAARAVLGEFDDALTGRLRRWR